MPAWFPRLDVYEEDVLTKAEEAFEAEVAAIRFASAPAPMGMSDKKEHEDEEEDEDANLEDEDDNQEFDDEETSDEV